MLRHLSAAQRRRPPCKRFASSSSLRDVNTRVNAFVSEIRNPLDSGLPSSVGPLAGKSIAIKDNICTSSFPTTCSSAFLQDFEPSYDATVVSLINNSGGHIIGKTNCDEFGMGSFNTHSIHGPVFNPFNLGSPSRSAGGSSGGSAAAVAAGMCYAALGTDTGGSVRLPASYCGVAGFKPSYGLISRWGVVSYADSLDCVGVLASNSRRIQEVTNAISVYDPKDPTSIPKDVREAAQAESSTLAHSKELIRVGIPQEYFPKEMDPSLLARFKVALSSLSQAERQIELVPVSLPSTKYALSAYYVLASAEASSNLARYDGAQYGKYVEPTEPCSDTAEIYAHSRTAGFGPEVRKRILLGTYALTAGAFDNYYLQAQRIRKLIRSDFDSVFRHKNILLEKPSPAAQDVGVDILVHPTAISSAPLLEDLRSKPKDDVDGYVQDILTVPASLAGLPCLSVPAGTAADGWPVGVSIVGQWGWDSFVLEVGAILEDVWRSA